MPHFTDNLSQGSSIITLVVTVSSARRDALITAKQPVPPEQMIRGLIDTGASSTCIDPEVFRALGITPTGTVPINTASSGETPVAADTYDVGILITSSPTSPALLIQSLEVTAVELLAVNDFHALIGCDILSRCILHYNGSTQTFTLAY